MEPRAGACVNIKHLSQTFPPPAGLSEDENGS